MPLAAGTRLGRYEVRSLLGEGGMGEVYLAEDTLLDRRVAIKLLLPSSTPDENARKRLVREAKAAATLDHPHICAIHEVGEEAGQSFIVMQYVEGETLADRMQRQPMSVQDVLTLAAQIADALAEAHAHGIIHRDIKPENISINARGRALVMDFGLAKAVTDRGAVQAEAETASLITSPGMIAGTVPYMSPEQVKGEALDARTDIFSFGVVLYEMLTGRHPFSEGNAASTISALLTREPLPLLRYSREAPAELERIVQKALAKDREARYQTAKDLLIDLKNLTRRLEFEAELERSTRPEARDPAGSDPGAPTVIATARARAVPTAADARAPKTTPGAGSVVNQVRRHGRGAGVTLIALATVMTVTLFWYFSHTRAAPLTEKDTILLADFDNATGDAVFDGTLKQGLAVQLSQSPFLNLFPETRVRQTLRLMGRPAEERVTQEVGREICQRQGLKAVIAGSIAPLGSHYVLTLEAVNSQTGEALARQQVEAEGKEQVLRALSQAAARLREELGESLSSVQRFDAPLEVTTSSLEALKAFSLGNEQQIRGKHLEALPFLKRAAELDPNFAYAYAGLAVQYINTNQPKLAAENAEKAFALRDRVSELEKLRISDFYYAFVTGEVEKSIEVLELHRRTYPRDARAHGNLSARYAVIGQYEKSSEAVRETIRLDPNLANGYGNLAYNLLRLNRPAEAKVVIEQALQQKLDATYFHTTLYQVAFLEGDAAAMQRQLAWASGKPDEYVALNWQAQTAAFAGQWRRSQDFARRAIDLAAGGPGKEVAAQYAAEAALRGAAFGQCAQARAAAARALSIERNKVSLTRAGLALALCGEGGQAQTLVEELKAQYPKDTLVQSLWLPTVLAALGLPRGDVTQAPELLQAAQRYEAAAEFWPQYVRALAYLKLSRPAEAEAEFRKILGARGQAPMSALYPLAHLGVARAAALAGDAAKSRKAYEDFFAPWKEADAELPVLTEAREEYEKLNRPGVRGA